MSVTAILTMAFSLKQLVVPKGKNTSPGEGSSHPELDSDTKERPEAEVDQDPLNPLAAQPQSPSPEAEYDKLLVSRNTTDNNSMWCNPESTDFAVLLFLKNVTEVKVSGKKKPTFMLLYGLYRYTLLFDIFIAEDHSYFVYKIIIKTL